MNYRNELKKYARHRKKYHPVISMLIDLYDTARPEVFPIPIADQKDMLIALELVDIGYLDPEAFDIKKKYGGITAVMLNGKYPLTEKGAVFYHEERPSGISNSFKALLYFFNRIIKRLL